MPLYRATATTLTNLVAADGSSGGFLKDSDAGAGGLAVLDDATFHAIYQTLAGSGGAGVFANARVLWYKTGADMNVTTDQALTKNGTFTNFIIFTCRCVNPSISLTTAAGGVYSATGKGGDALVANTQVYSTASSASTGQGMSLAAAGNGLRSDTALYLSLTTPQGAAATADIYVLGIPLS